MADTNNRRIAIYEATGAEATLVGELRGAIRRPEGVAVHPNGRVYATGANSGNIEAFETDRPVNMTADLQLNKVVAGSPYDCKGPRHLDFDTAGRLYVADKYSRQIKILAADGTLLLTLGSGRSELGPGKFDRPEGVAIRGAYAWFSDTYNNHIVRYRIVE